jgi:ribosomal protein L7/L12
MNEQPDFRAIGIALAQVDPDRFTRLHEQTNPVATPQWIKDTVSFMASQNLVMAVKTARNATGLSLRDAKAVCDQAAWELNLRKDAPHLSIDSLEMRKHVQQMVNYGKHAVPR